MRIVAHTIGLEVVVVVAGPVQMGQPGQVERYGVWTDPPTQHPDTELESSPRWKATPGQEGSLAKVDMEKREVVRRARVRGCILLRGK